MEKVKREIKDLKITAIAALTNKRRGANGTPFICFKSEDGGSMDIKNELLIELQEIAKSELPKEVKEEIEKIEKALSSDASDALKMALKTLAKYKDQVGDVMKVIASKVGYGYAAPEKKQDGEKSPYKKPYGDMKKEFVLALAKEHREPVLKALEVYETEIVKVELPGEDPRIEKLQKELENEKSLRVRKECEEKIEKEYKHIGIKKEELAETILKIEASLDEKESKKFHEVLKAIDSQACDAQKIITKELGSNLSGNSDVWGKIEKEAEKVMKEDSKISKEQAIDKVLKENPKLYSEYNQEGR